MKIAAFRYNPYTQQNSFNKERISFTNTRTWEGNISNQTCFFRPDLDWEDTVDYIVDTMPKKTKIYNYACSDGSEAYSLALQFISKLGYKKAKNYFPINAFDISKNYVKLGQEGVVDIEMTRNVTPEEQRINRLGLNFKKYFRKLKNYQGIRPDNIDYTLNDQRPLVKNKVLQPLKNAVNFQLGDITKDMQDPIDDKPCVVLFRNAWRYLKSDDERKKLAENMFKNLKENSIVIIGDAEYADKCYPILINAGFERCFYKDSSLYNVLIKPQNKSKN